jgi:hypothetical protein
MREGGEREGERGGKSGRGGRAGAEGGKEIRKGQN